MQSGVDLDSAKLSMNPFCEIALEAALRLRESGQVEEVIAATVGDQVRTYNQFSRTCLYHRTVDYQFTHQAPIASRRSTPLCRHDELI